LQKTPIKKMGSLKIKKKPQRDGTKKGTKASWVRRKPATRWEREVERVMRWET
jgi:hypothetical protein